MKNICIIGAGNIGSRHLQAIKNVKFPLTIEVVDPSDDSLAIAKQRYEQVQSKHNHKIKFLKDIEDISEKIDIVIIATNSNIRKNIIEQVLNHSKVTYFILEKLLFQKKQDYFKVQTLLEKSRCKTWVNCGMRTMPFYFNMKKSIKGKIEYFVNGGQFGLITNAIHYIDHMSYLTGSDEFIIDTKLLDPKPIESKRKGFLELNGTLNVYFKEGSFGSFTCYASGSAPIIVEILSDGFRCISKESENRALVSYSNEWQWEKINNILLRQSEMTNLIVEDIFKNGSCKLTPLSSSIKIHLQLLERLYKFLNKQSLKKYILYPFT